MIGVYIKVPKRPESEQKIPSHKANFSIDIFLESLYGIAGSSSSAEIPSVSEIDIAISLGMTMSSSIFLLLSIPDATPETSCCSRMCG